MLTREVAREVEMVWQYPERDYGAALRALAGALLDLDRAVRELEKKVERAERLAGS